TMGDGVGTERLQLITRYDLKEAFILRIGPSEKDSVEEALKCDQIIIGWSETPELLDDKLEWNQFREILRRHYYPNEPDLRRVGNAAGHMWRFIREMKTNNLVIVPHGSKFYVAEVLGEATHDPS